MPLDRDAIFRKRRGDELDEGARKKRARLPPALIAPVMSVGMPELCDSEEGAMGFARAPFSETPGFPMSACRSPTTAGQRSADWPPKNDLGVYSHDHKVSRDYHAAILERVGLANALAYRIQRDDRSWYDRVVSPDRVPFLTSDDDVQIQWGTFNTMQPTNTYVLIGRRDGKPVYCEMMLEQLSKARPAECRFLGLTTPPAIRPLLSEANCRPFLSRNFALLNDAEKQEVTGRPVRSWRPDQAAMQVLAEGILHRMGLSKSLLQNARQGAPLILDGVSARSLFAQGRALSSPTSGQCLLVSVDKGPTYIRLSAHQSSQLSQKDRCHLGFVPPWTRHLGPTDKYRLGLLPPGSMALEDARQEDPLLDAALLARRLGRDMDEKSRGEGEQNSTGRDRPLDRSRSVREGR